jgi:hypothetical protein
MNERSTEPASGPKLTKLVDADIYRDGGSYSASFETENGSIYSVWLQRSKMPDSEGLHHRWLFAYVGLERPQDCLPIVTGSAEETALLTRLRDFLADHASEEREYSLGRLRELVHHAERREPCFPDDLPNRPWE